MFWFVVWKKGFVLGLICAAAESAWLRSTLAGQAHIFKK
jgi:hypothetical protein